MMLMLFCPLRHHHHHRSQSTRYSHDIATPLVMGGLGVGGMTTPQLHHSSGESRLRANSNAVVSSRRSSSLATNNSLADSPTRKGSDDPMTVSALAQATVVNWRGRSGSIDCRVLTRNNAGGLVDETAFSHSLVATSPLLAGSSLAKRRLSKPRASISGCTYSLDRRPSSSSNCNSNDVNQIEMRQRSQTFSDARLTSARHPSANTTAVSLRSEASSSAIVSSVIATANTSSSSASGGGNTTDRSRPTKKRRPSSTTATAAAAAAAAVAAAELKAFNHPLAYPSLDFFDIGLEDYGRRSTSSFSRFIQHQQQPPSILPPLPAPPPPLPTSSQLVSSQVSQQQQQQQQPQQQQTSSSSASGTSGNNGRRRRTCSFSKVLSRGSKQPTASRWPAVFGSGKQQEIGKSSASSMPSVQQIPSLVTAV